MMLAPAALVLSIRKKPAATITAKAITIAAATDRHRRRRFTRRAYATAHPGLNSGAPALGCCRSADVSPLSTLETVAFD